MKMLNALLSGLLICSCNSGILDFEDIEIYNPVIEEKGIQTCFEQEMIETVNSINDIITKDALVLNILTDNHISSSVDNVKANNATIQNIYALNKQVHCDGVVHMGDIVAQSLAKNDSLTDGNIFSIMNNYITSLSKTNDRVFFINGNHDGLRANYFRQDPWMSITKPILGGYVTYSEDAPYYYYDYNEKHVRCIFLALPDYYKSSAVYGYTTRALNWLKDDALQVPDNTDVIIFGHIPVFHANYIQNGMLANRTSFEGICNAFNDHTTYKDSFISK